jgi:chromosome segregation ATPase
MEQPNLSTQLADLEHKFQEIQGKVALLQQRIEGQAYDLQERATRIQELEEELVQTRTQQLRPADIDEAVAHLKAELLQFIETRVERKQPGNLDSDPNLIRPQLDSQAKAIVEIRREVEKTRRFDDQIAAARTEVARLNGEIHRLREGQAELTKQLDERVRPLSFIEDQHRNNARILAELQAELPDLHRKIDTNLAKIQLVEQKTPQFTKYETALDSIREEIRRHREQVDFQASERERQLKNWNDIAETSEQRLRENEALLEKYAENYQVNKRALASLQDFQERLQRDHHRFAELQRLAEERQRAEVEKFRADYEQRWKKHVKEYEPHFGDFQKSLEAVQLRLEEISKISRLFEEQMNMVLQIIEEDIQARALAASNWQERFEELADGQT